MKPFMEYLKPRVNSIFTLRPTEKNSVCGLLCKFSENKASGLDSISCRLLREAAPVIADSLSCLISL